MMIDQIDNGWEVFAFPSLLLQADALPISAVV
jgi:hypothetical protein